MHITVILNTAAWSLAFAAASALAYGDNHAMPPAHHAATGEAAAYMVHVQPGRSGAIVWQFTKPGEYRFACLVPGHVEAGMVGRVVMQ